MAELATIARPYAEALFKSAKADLGGAASWLDQFAAIAAIAARGGTSGSGSSWSPTVTSSGAVSDEDQRRRLEAIGEYDTYTGVDGTDVQSSIHGGDRVFQNTSDPYSTYSTNDPYATPADGYTELQQRE